MSVEGVALAAMLVVMVEGTAVQTHIDSYNTCQQTAELLKREGREAFCIPKQKETDRMRTMMWDFMDIIDAIRNRSEGYDQGEPKGRCGGIQGSPMIPNKKKSI